MSLGKSIRRLRELKGVSREYIASRLGMGVTAYGNIERDYVKNLAVNKLSEIADILEIDICMILRFDAKTDQLVGGGVVSQAARSEQEAITDAFAELRVVLMIQRQANEKMLEALNLVVLLLKQKI
ncbi:helix-turn-helix transcriptional regulator [Chitinophaga horti]|uniref:Helix-turn-helix transcriptional regulator n=1 Tax=Chitinophaga horti TaxID=2920382 RepID=A0ABY6IVC2_9BACT|nr:helix-turn-helix transcriptional regulator [Chitinophaga horti]UYQ91240.1 helix-turn-helix transcriptional regulator [Chitinophaga horti]